jgi:hypothetical protein
MAMLEQELWIWPPAVNRLVAGSNPARGATANQRLSAIRILQFHPVWHAIGTRAVARPLHCEHVGSIETVTTDPSCIGFSGLITVRG